MQPRDDRPVDHVLNALGDRARLDGREDAVLRERQLGGDGEHRRRADRVAQGPRGLDGSVGLRRQDDDISPGGGVLVRGARDPECGRCRPGTLLVARADHYLVAGIAQANGERRSEAPGTADQGDPHVRVSKAASRVVRASRRAASRLVMSVSATTTATSNRAGASARSITSASSKPL